jgi:hypothetical protein
VEEEVVMRIDKNEPLMIDGRVDIESLSEASQRHEKKENYIEDPHPWKRREQETWRIFIMYQHNIEILKQAVRSYDAASDIMTANMIIIDNSVTHEALNDDYIVDTVNEVILTKSRLNFPQLHNFMAEVALQKRLEFFFWAHSDNYVLPANPTRDLGKDILQCLADHQQKQPNWAGIFYSYDHLAAFRTKPLVQVPWDPHVFQYGMCTYAFHTPAVFLRILA